MTIVEERLARLLAAVIANPDDDEIRLVYADAIDDHGDPERAEFIRAQIALAAIDESKPCGGYYCDVWGDGTPLHRDCKIAHLRGIEWRHLQTSIFFWGADLQPLAGMAGNGYCTWTRGFISGVRCRWDQWAEHGAIAIRQQPVTRVELSDVRPSPKSDDGYCRLWSPAPPPYNRTPYVSSKWTVPLPLWPAFQSVALRRDDDGYTDDIESLIAYLDPANAREDLSTACLEYARQQESAHAR